MGNAHRKRKRMLNVFLLDEELAILEAKADEAEITKSEYVRNMILFGNVFERTNFTREEAQAILYELNRIGNNLNQVAYRANANKTIDDRDFNDLFQNYVELLSAYDSFLRGKNNGDY